MSLGRDYLDDNAWDLDQAETYNEFTEELCAMVALKEKTMSEIIDVPILDLTSSTATILPIIQFNKSIWIKKIDEMNIEDLTPGFIKEIKDAAIAIDKRISAPIKAWRGEVDDIIDHINKRRAVLVEAAAKIETERKIAKEKEVIQLIVEALAVSRLNNKYKSQLTIIDKYLNKGETLSKIMDDLTQRITNLQLQQDNEELAEKARLEQVKNRELLIENLNAKYQQEFKYSHFTVESFIDDEIQDFYKSSAKEVEETKVNLAHIIEEKEPKHRTIKIIGASLDVIDQLINAIKSKGFDVEVLNG